MFDPLFHFMADVMSFLYDLWPSYGGAIILFTLMVMSVMAPVTLRQTKNMLAMSRLQPEVKRLRSKYGNDRERLNQEMMALYQANSVNPLSGCLPMLVQMPVFIVLYRLVRGLSRRVSDVGMSIGDFSQRDGLSLSTFPKRVFNPDFLDASSQMSMDLRGHTEMKSLGIDLSQTPSQALSEGLVHALPYLLMVLVVGLTSWLQQKQIQGRSTNASMNPQQQAIMKVLPFMLPVFSFTMPAALVVYFLVSNTFRVFQQMVITRKFYSGSDDGPEIVRPVAADKAADDAGSRRTPAASSGVNHGSRRPVKNPPKKRTRKPATGGPATAPGSKKSTGETPTRSQSKRVTPKKDQDEQNSGSRRRDKKR